MNLFNNLFIGQYRLTSMICFDIWRLQLDVIWCCSIHHVWDRTSEFGFILTLC